MTIILPASISEPQIQVTPLNSPVGLGGSISNTDPLPGVSPHITSQFPAFVSEDHPRFIEFMEAYYRWMESNGETLHEARRLPQNQDIDTASDEYVEHFFNEFLSIIPRNIVADKATVLKNIKQFYGAKGTEKSFKFLFRILFNADSYLYYPKDDILRTSDGKWIQNKTLRLTNVVGDVKKFRAQKIRGTTNNSSAFVERLYGINFGDYSAHELVLNRASITGKFLPGETVVSEDGTVQATISPIPETVRVVQPGANYKVGDKFKVDYIGKGAIIRVAEVDKNGGITRFYIQEYGIGYDTQRPPKNIKCTDATHFVYGPGDVGIAVENPDIAIVNINLGSTTNYPGYFRNEDGQLSTTKYIHDGYYYQQFSYVTNTSESFDKYKDVMNKAVHPLGFKHFGSVAIETFLNVGVKLPEDATHIHIIANTTPTTSTLQSVRTEIIHPNEITNLNTLGATYDSVLRDKFSYKPFMKYDANAEFDGLNSHHFGTGLNNRLAATPVSTFEIAKIGVDSPRELETHRTKSIRLQSDAVIIQSPDRIQIVAQHERNVIQATEVGETVTVTFSVTNDSEANYTWILKKDGVEIARGEQATGNVAVDVTASVCRLALFVIDDFGRQYKSENVGVKIVE